MGDKRKVWAIDAILNKIGKSFAKNQDQIDNLFMLAQKYDRETGSYPLYQRYARWGLLHILMELMYNAEIKIVISDVIGGQRED